MVRKNFSTYHTLICCLSHSLQLREGIHCRDKEEVGDGIKEHKDSSKNGKLRKSVIAEYQDNHHLTVTLPCFYTAAIRHVMDHVHLSNLLGTFPVCHFNTQTRHGSYAPKQPTRHLPCVSFQYSDTSWIMCTLATY